jgi:hypothetical protein
MTGSFWWDLLMSIAAAVLLVRWRRGHRFARGASSAAVTRSSRRSRAGDGEPCALHDDNLAWRVAVDLISHPEAVTAVIRWAVNTIY